MMMWKVIGRDHGWDNVVALFDQSKYTEEQVKERFGSNGYIVTTDYLSDLEDFED